MERYFVSRIGQCVTRKSDLGFQMYSNVSAAPDLTVSQPQLTRGQRIHTVVIVYFVSDK